MRWLVALAMLACATVAHAAPHQVMVLRAEGTADAATRTTVEAHVLRLARHIDGKVEMAEITLADAAAAAGCSAADAACKDEILMTFAVDELVTTNVSAGKNGQVTVTVRRLTRGAAPKAETSTLPASAPQAKLEADIGPLFGLARRPERDVTDKPADPNVTDTPAAHELSPTDAPPAETESPPAVPVDPYASPNEPTALAAPLTDPSEPPPPNRRLQKIGMGVGAGLVVLGVLMWSAAADKQEQIDSAPVDTPTDFMRLRELEREADGLAGGGNLFFLGGAVLGGVSAYYYWKKGKTARQQAAIRVTPTMFPHGGGVVLSFGGGS